MINSITPSVLRRAADAMDEQLALDPGDEVYAVTLTIDNGRVDVVINGVPARGLDEDFDVTLVLDR